MITRSKLNLNDYQWNIGDLLQDIEDGFDLKVTETRLLPYINSFQNSITFEMSLQRNEVSRTVYSLMDFLGDLGGLFSALGPFFGTLVAVLQYRGMYMQLVNHMIS